MYTDLAGYWPLVSPAEGYADEARHWRDALRAHLGPGRHRLLELGVGGGNNLSHLTCDFDAVAVDLSEGMLAHSRRQNPTVEHHVGDMRTVRLGRRFDAVLIHDAASYLTSEDDLRATFATAVAHLRPGGVFLCAPDWFTETFPGRHASVHGPRGPIHPASSGSRAAGDTAGPATSPSVPPAPAAPGPAPGPPPGCASATSSFAPLTLTFFEYTHDPDPTDTTIEALHLFVLTDPDGQVRVVEDRHVLGLLPVDTWLRLMAAAGLTPSRRPYPVHPDGHDAWILVGELPAPARAR